MKVLIVDAPISGSISKRLKALGITLVDPQNATRELLQWEGWEMIDRTTTTLIFPGHGALKVYKCLSGHGNWDDGWRWILFPQAKRYWEPGREPFAQVAEVPWEISGIRDVVVVDDVISSGSTCRALREKNAERIPGAEWHAVSWVKQQAALLPGFSLLYASIEVGTRAKKIPVNSLSTLLEKREMAADYAQRNFPDPRRFTLLLKEVRTQCR